VGTRPYIRGADVLLHLFAQLRAAPGGPGYPARLDSWKMVREVTRDGQWQAADASLSAPGGPGPAMLLEWTDAAGSRHAAGFAEAGDVIRCRVANRPPALETIEPGGDFAGLASYGAEADFAALAYGVVEGNKALHAATLSARGLSAAGVRLVWVEGLPVPAAPLPDPAAAAVRSSGHSLTRLGK